MFYLFAFFFLLFAFYLFNKLKNKRDTSIRITIATFAIAT